MYEKPPEQNLKSLAAIFLVLLSTLPMLQGVLIAPLLAVIRESEGHQANQTFLLRLMMVAPAFTIVLLIPFIGRFADRFSRHHILIIGLLLYAACGLAAFVAPSIEWILVSRFVLGAPLALIMTIATASTGDFFAPDERNRLLGIQYLASTFVGMSVPILGGLVALIDWRLNFIIYLIALPFLALAPVLRVVGLREKRDVEKEIKLEVRATLGILFLAAAGATILWLLTLQLAFHLSEIGFASPVSAGIALGAPCLSGMASGLMYPALKRRLPPRWVAALAFGLMGLGYVVMSLAASVPALGIGLLLCGFGFGFNQTNCAAWLLSVAPPEARGRAAAGLTFAVFFGQLLSPFVYQPLVAMFGSAATFALVAAICLLIACLTYFAPSADENADPRVLVRDNR
jgi:MFS family permease